jgi:hypothetical protein
MIVAESEEFEIMKTVISMLLLLALSLPALAQNQGGNQGGNQGNIRGAPGPLMGAGLLPVLLVGGGIYWLVRRKKTQSS